MSQWARVPSADAYVIVHWQGTIPRLGHAESVCLHAAIGKTDAQGRFEVSGSWAAPKGFPVFRRDPAVMVHKPGFDQQSGFRGGSAPVERTLVRTKLDAEQRVVLLSMIAESGCWDHDTIRIIPLRDPQRVAAPFYRALYDEALTLGPLSPKSNHALATLRDRAGVPQPAPPPPQIRAIRPQQVRPATPANRP